MTNVANWVEEATTDGGTSQAITLTGAAFANAATFAQAFGAAPVDVYYSIENGDNSEAGVGNFNGTTGLSRDTVQATHVSGVYDDTSPARINLVGDSIVRCTFNAAVFNEFITSAEVTYETLDANGDVGVGADQLAIGDHLHTGVYATAAQGVLADSSVQPDDDVATLGSGLADADQVAVADGAGNVSWVDQSGSGGIPDAPDNGNAYVRETGAWHRGSRIFIQAVDPSASMSDGDHWIPIPP